MEQLQSPYDAVSYPSYPFPNTHPDRLASMAILHGLSPAPVEHSRVLEIACNEGANLIPMAYTMPGSEFVGFDLARLTIERGQRRIDDLGLKNIRLFADDLMDVGAELGQFDYIIVHGLYSWVPEPVRDRLMGLCSELLAPNGVVFVSYNALPGGHLRSMIREMMLYRVEGIADPQERVREALKFLHFLLEARPERDAFRVLLEEQLKRMETHRPEATYHDELGETFHPLHFISFVEHAQEHGLQYLCDAELPPPPDPSYRFDLRSKLESVAPGDILKQEQMLDFVRARGYRETLLCKGNLAPQRDFKPERFRRLMFASQAVSKTDEETGTVTHVLPGGVKMESNYPGVRKLLRELETAWPRALSYEELEPRLAVTGSSLNADGATLLMRLAVARMIELRSWNAPLAAGISERPRVSACSRQEALMHPLATTLLHLSVQLEDPLVRSFVNLLDGSRNRREVLDAMIAEFPSTPAEDLEAGFDSSIEFIHRAGLLEA